ncbi:MAG: ABC transporter substrate-binding protein [Oligoflexia bacterium]|nr:ABC transporter substrate-binding protein [Oligoflexia bacterium]
MIQFLKFLTVAQMLIMALLSEASAAPTQHKIGAALGITGMANIWGKAARQAIELAVEEVNANSKYKDSIQIELKLEDTQSTAAAAITAYNKLVSQDKVEAVIGDVWAFLTTPLVPLSARDKVVLISPTVMDKSMHERSDYFFSFGHSFAGLKASAERFFRLHPKVKKIAMVSFDDYWNNAMSEMFQEAAAATGVEVLRDIKLTDWFADFRSETSVLKSLGVDAVVGAWHPETLRQRMQEQKLDVPLISSSDAVEAVLFRGGAMVLEGVYFLDWPVPAEFTASYRQRFGEAPTHEAHNAYQIVVALAEAWLTSEGDLRSRLLASKYRGITGAIDFSKAPFVNQASGELFKVSAGKFVGVQ